MRRETMSKSLQDWQRGPLSRVPWVRGPEWWGVWDFVRRMGRDVGMATRLQSKKRLRQTMKHQGHTPLQRRRGRRGRGDRVQARVLAHLMSFWSGLTKAERDHLSTMTWFNAERWVVPTRGLLRVCRRLVFYEKARVMVLRDLAHFSSQVQKQGAPGESMESVGLEQRKERLRAYESFNETRVEARVRRTKVAHRMITLHREMRMFALDPLVRLRRSTSEGLSRLFTNIPTSYPQVDDYGMHADSMARRARAYELAHVQLRKETWKRLRSEIWRPITEYERLRGAGAPTNWLTQLNLVDVDASWVNERAVLEGSSLSEVEKAGRRDEDRVSEIRPGDEEYTPPSPPEYRTEEEEIERWLAQQKRPKRAAPDEMTTGMDPRLSYEDAFFHVRVLSPKDRHRRLGAIGEDSSAQQRSPRRRVRWVSAEERTSSRGRARWWLRMSRSPWSPSWWSGFTVMTVIPTTTSLGLVEETRVRDVMSQRPMPPKPAQPVQPVEQCQEKKERGWAPHKPPKC